jgi:nucleoside-diphosphate-sugar epimerase
MKKVLVCGAGGFIGVHLVNDLKSQGFYVIGVDLRYPEFSQTTADEFHIADLRNQEHVSKIITHDLYEIYQLAADMGGAGYIFTGDNDADIMYNSSIINLNILREMVEKGVNRIFYSSSACMYPEHNQTDPTNPLLSEDSAYPANPDSEYGWEKLFSERLFLSFAKNYGIRVRIARFHNVFGPESSWTGGKEKSPAAICRKVAETETGEIEVWGPGTQTRSYLYIDECIAGIKKIVDGDYSLPLNLGSERMISINELAMLVGRLTNKNIQIKNVAGPIGVAGRTSHNKLIKEQLNWEPPDNLEFGLLNTYKWILDQIDADIK